MPASVAIHYLIVVPVRFHRSSPSTVAVESAFAEHLRVLRDRLAPHFDELTIAGPTMPRAQYERDRGHLASIDEERERMRFAALHPAESGRAMFWLRHFASIAPRLWREVRRADVVHSGLSHNLFQPVEFLALAFAKISRKPTICVVDIDTRADARMNQATGRWSRKSVVLCRAVYDPLRTLQLAAAARWCSLVLLKGRRLCRDFGAGRPHVKYFLDAAFSGEHVIPQDALERKRHALSDPTAPLELVYFGRLTAYKGVDRCIEALAAARRRTSAPLRLHVIGTGEEEANLRALCRRLDVDDRVRFHAALPFGSALFAALYTHHLSLAAPLSEDTPRSALDAMASGIPILAFGTEYYTDLHASGAVDVVPWPSVADMSERIAHYADDKRRLLPLVDAAIAFARANTQETWLDARVRWTLALLAARGESASSAKVVRSCRPRTSKGEHDRRRLLEIRRGSCDAEPARTEDFRAE
ncbi:MAG: glycosyltransferase [Planctomycetota bacterium]